nr:MAG TPA: hypothetical protein [Caudoviricetes sp.]
MFAVFVFIELQDKMQDIEIRFGNNVLQSEVCLAGMKKPSPVAGGRGLRGDCSLIRNRGICLVAMRSGEADEAVVFAVGFHVPGVFRVVEGGVVRVVGVGEHGMGFFCVAAARNGGFAADEGVFAGGCHEGMQKLEAFGALQWGEVFGGEAGFGAELGRELFDGSHVGVEVGAPFFLECLGGLGEGFLFGFLKSRDDAGDVFSCGFAVKARSLGLFGDEVAEVVGCLEVFREFNGVFSGVRVFFFGWLLRICSVAGCGIRFRIGIQVEVGVFPFSGCRVFVTGYRGRRFGRRGGRVLLSGRGDVCGGFFSQERVEWVE